MGCRLLDCSHFDWHEMAPHCGFDLHFSDNEWCWASFHVFFSHLYVFFAASAAAKLLQSCPTLCDPIDRSPPDSPVPGILQARTLEWVAISFSKTEKWNWSHSVMSNSSQTHELQPTRLLRPWNFPGKRTGVGAIAFSGHKLVLSKDDHKGHYPFLSLTPFAPSLWGRGGHTHQSPLGSTKTYPKNGGHCFWWCHYIQCQILLSISLQGERRGIFTLLVTETVNISCWWRRKHDFFRKERNLRTFPKK